MIDIPKFELLLKAETAKRCGHEERKGQLSMSWLSLSDQEILARMKNGHTVDTETKLKLHKGTMAENDLRDRIIAVSESEVGRKIGRWGPPRTLVAYDGRLLGHTDGEIDSTLIEVKTVPDRAVLEKIKQLPILPFKVRAQTNAYMFWGRYRDALVVYETRVEGDLWPVGVRPDLELQRELRKKAERILAMTK